MPDDRINREDVLAAIYGRRNRRRVIWSASTTLAAMGIEHYPHVPPKNYRQMKRVLKGLCTEGHLIQRAHLHSHYTLKEVAYERVPSDHSAGRVTDNPALQRTGRAELSS